MKIHVVVDYDLCEANAKCQTGAPEVFRVESDDTLTVLQEYPDEALRRRLDGCVKACPKRAIRLDIEDD